MRAASTLRAVLVIVLTTVAPGLAIAQSTPSLHLSGTISSGTARLPGVLISAESIATGQTASTASDDDGQYRLVLPASGSYRVRVELFGFSPVTRVLSLADSEIHADFSLVLARVQKRVTEYQLQTAQATSPHDSQQATRKRPGVKPATPPSADMPMDFSFITGQVAQPVSAEEGASGTAVQQLPVHLNAYYQAGNSALDASPYALHGIAAAKPQYSQNTFGASAGGMLPGLGKGTTSLYLNYSGNRSGNPYNGFASVPTAGMREGDFSGLRVPSGPAAGQPVILYDPQTSEPFPNNRIPPGRMSPAALGLLRFMPLPNRDGLSQNFRFVSATHSRSDALALMLARVPAVRTTSANDPQIWNNFNLALNYVRSQTNLPNMFPLLGGDNTSHSWNGSFSYTLTKGFFENDLRLGFDSISSRTSNHFYSDVAAALGINGVSPDRFDWGLPLIAFSQFTGLQDVAPALHRDRNISIADTVNWSSGKHNLKWGGEYKRLAFDLRSSNGASGSFMFTGFATAHLAGGVPVPGAGSDLADFLLGLPQKTHVQYSGGTFSFVGDAWSLYVVDDWRLASNVTLNVGLRYEYLSPFSEAHNRLVTLDAPADFSAIAVVRAGDVGPFTGGYPDTIVAPDRNNLAPRLGIAWRPAQRFIVRAGYGIDYDPSLYNSLATSLSQQPPFAVARTGIAAASQVLTLSNGFPALQADAVTNDFAVPRNLPLGYAQVWVLELQNELPAGLVLVTSYTGTKGSHLAMLRAPNRTVTGLLLPHADPFLWQTAEGSSILHAGSLRLQKRLEHGLSFGASYMFSRSLDDVPALGDQVPVPQDESNLKADRSLSAFDQRHRLAVDYAYEIPFGPGKRWLGTSKLAKHVLGNSVLSGRIRYETGYDLTPHVLGDFADVNSGGYGALRPNITGEPIALPAPTTEQFFNTSAFVPPPIGSYGNAARNSIIGPSIFGMDMALTKSFRLSEGHTLQFRAQASNVLNTPQFTQVDANLRSLSYGQITGVGKTRVIQLGLRYWF